MTLQSIQNIVEHDFAALNFLINDNRHSNINLIERSCEHIFESGGKRLRPLIVLLASHACGYEGEYHIPLAAGIEYFHTATLLHDDVVDDSTLRRGKKTSHEIWGNKSCILVGDYLFTQAFKFFIEANRVDILHLFSDITHQISCGEIKQLDNKHNINTSEQDYFEIIRSKTALLFSGSAEVGAYLSNSSPEIKEAMKYYGLHLGNAFQLIDDALDYNSSAEVIGKNIGDDLADGKLTLPLIYAFKNSSPSDKQIIKHCVEEGSIERIEEIKAIIDKTNSIQYTNQVAKQEIEHSIEALSMLPESQYKQGLIELAHFSITRSY